MCNLFEQDIAWQAYVAAMQGEAWHIPVHQTELDLEPRAKVAITDQAAALISTGRGAAQLVPMTFSYPSSRPAGPVFNVVSEGRDYRRLARCLIPASAFFEFTKPLDPSQRRKDRWRFTRTDGATLGLPALWKPLEGNRPPGFALPTVDPGPDVGAVHNRQIVVLEPKQWRSWLEDGDKAGFGPSPAGTFQRVLSMSG